MPVPSLVYHPDVVKQLFTSSLKAALDSIEMTQGVKNTVSILGAGMIEIIYLILKELWAAVDEPDQPRLLEQLRHRGV